MDIFLESPIFGGSTIGKDYELYLWAALAQQSWLFWPDFTHIHAHTNVCRWIVLSAVWHRSHDSLLFIPVHFLILCYLTGLLNL